MGLSKAEKLLVTAGLLSAGDQTDFTAEDLVAKAFQEFKHDFSLKGHPEYPDSNAVLTQVMGRKAPLIVKGWLEKTGTKRYRITPKGLHDLKSINEEAYDGASVHVDRNLEEGIGRLITSAAYKMFSAGRQGEITFHQFCLFVGLSARDKWQKVVGKMSSLTHLVQEARRIGESGQTLSLHFQGRNHVVSPDDLRELAAVQKFLENRFKKEMEEWRQHAAG